MFVRIPVKNGERILNINMIRTIYRLQNSIYYEYSSSHISPYITTADSVWHTHHDTEEEAKDAFEKLATELRYRETQMR